MVSHTKWRRVAVDLLEHHDSRTGKLAGYGLVGLIVLSMLVFVFQTMVWATDYAHYFYIFDIFLAVVFTIEYIGRLSLSPNKLKFLFSPLGLVDLLVLVSFYFAFSSLAVLRGFRILKIFQLLKIIRYSEFLHGFLHTFRNYKNEFRIFWVLFVMVLLFSSTGMYYLEHLVNEDIASIPDAFWWAIVTMTTVGYGDAVPVTLAGRALAGVVMVMGLALIAILTAIVTKMFMDHFFGKRYHVCVKCNYPRHDFDASHCKNCGERLDIDFSKYHTEVKG